MKPLSLQKPRQSKGSQPKKRRRYNTYSPSQLPPMLLYKIQPCTKCQNNEKGIIAYMNHEAYKIRDVWHRFTVGRSIT